MRRLSTTVHGITFENPFVLASAPPTARLESIRKAFSLGWGGAVLKTITPDDLEMREVSPRFGVLRSRNGKEIFGFENMELLSHKSVAYWQEAAAALKKEFPQKIVIASIMAPVEKQAWQDLARQIQQSPVDALELNFSCPHGMPEKGIGMAIGTDAELSGEITSWVKAVAGVPVFAKLSPNVTDIAKIAQAVEAKGADGFTAINTVQSLIGVDLETLRPLPDVDGGSTFGGYSGRAVKPIGLRCAAQIKAKSKLPLMASGGISSWRDAAEYVAVGASVVQVCTAAMLGGYAIVEQMIEGLSDYLEKTGFSSLDDMRGAALSRLTTHESLNRQMPPAPRLDPAKCRHCGICETLCDESGHQAISSPEGDIAVSEEKCERCSLCVHACPFGALTM